MFNLSSAEGPRFAEIVTEMSRRLANWATARCGPTASAVEQHVETMTQQAEAGPGRSES